MNVSPPLPERLRQAIEADHRPVHPLPRAERRVVWVALCAAVLLAVAPAAFGRRSNAAELGAIVFWGATAAQCAVGLLLAWLALREAIPAAGASLNRRAAALAGGVVFQVLASLAGWARLGGAPAAAFSHGSTCAALETVIAIPALIVTLVLVARAYAVRPGWAGVLGGMGSGLIADGAWRLVCPYGDLTHLLVWHTGAVVLLALLGLVAGTLIGSQRTRGARHHTAA
jgi:hypothetical protein